MTEQTIRYIILSILTLLSGSVYALVENRPFPSESKIEQFPLIQTQHNQKEALNYLNYLRKKSGLIPLKENSSLNKAAKNHAHYLIENSQIGHKEIKSKKFYTGMYGSHRSLHASYSTSQVIENISSNVQNHYQSIDGLMGAIYHRFAFLNFYIDEIGIGVAQNLKNHQKSAFVYDMGNSHINKLCSEKRATFKEKSTINICRDKTYQPSVKAFALALHHYDKINNPIITYPFEGQRSVPPVFYEEIPDPLPEYGVSGFPVSIAFNPQLFKKIQLSSFKLFKENSKQSIDAIVYDQYSDPNKMLEEYTYALFPLKRLKWNQKYNAKVEYLQNGILKQKEWSFTTKAFKETFYTVTTSKVYTIHLKEKSIFYFPPQSKNDILGNIYFPENLKIRFIDKNTLQIVALSSSKKNVKLQLGKRTLELYIKK